MTAKEAVESLKDISDDPEIGHREAEEILCAFLSANGFPEVASAFDEARDRLGFWYA